MYLTGEGYASLPNLFKKTLPMSLHLMYNLTLAFFLGGVAPAWNSFSYWTVFKNRVTLFSLSEPSVYFGDSVQQVLDKCSLWQIRWLKIAPEFLGAPRAYQLRKTFIV